MANFSKVLGLASTALVFAGMAFGQNCTGGMAVQSPLIRAEGTTELVGEYSFTCTVAATINILDIVSLPVTSKVLSTSGATSGQTEAIAVVSSPAGVFNGTVSGSQITFNNVPVAAGATVTIANVRVNASSLSVGSGAPPAVTESAFISGSGVQASVTTSQSVAFGLAGLAAQTAFKNISLATKGVNSFLVCQSYSAKAQSPLIAALSVKENFATAFKGDGSSATNNALGSEFANNTETGVGTTVSGANNSAATGTIIQVALTNIANGVSIFMPVTLNDVNAVGSTLTLITSPSNTTPLTTSASSSAVAGTAALTASSGAVTAFYLFTPAAANASNSAVDAFSIPIYGNAAANSVVATSTPLTANVSFGPVGSTQIPNFVVGSSTAAITLNTFAACSTSLLFPFVTNQLGFDTGIAISNTSSDPFGSNGATAQAGTCALNFYGAGAPSPANVTSPNVPSGTSYTTVLSSVAAGFQGYIIAQCNFQFAHGFAFVTTGLGTSSALAEGYLAGVIPDTNQVGRSATPVGCSSLTVTSNIAGAGITGGVSSSCSAVGESLGN